MCLISWAREVCCRALSSILWGVLEPGGCAGGGGGVPGVGAAGGAEPGVPGAGGVGAAGGGVEGSAGAGGSMGTATWTGPSTITAEIQLRVRTSCDRKID